MSATSRAQDVQVEPSKSSHNFVRPDRPIQAGMAHRDLPIMRSTGPWPPNINKYPQEPSRPVRPFATPPKRAIIHDSRQTPSVQRRSVASNSSVQAIIKAYPRVLNEANRLAQMFVQFARYGSRGPDEIKGRILEVLCNSLASLTSGKEAAPPEDDGQYRCSYEHCRKLKKTRSDLKYVMSSLKMRIVYRCCHSVCVSQTAPKFAVFTKARQASSFSFVLYALRRALLIQITCT